LIKNDILKIIGAFKTAKRKWKGTNEFWIENLDW
jgi:hypothetical protein